MSRAAAVPFHKPPVKETGVPDSLKAVLAELLAGPTFPRPLGLGRVAFPGGALPSAPAVGPVLTPDYQPVAQPKPVSPPPALPALSAVPSPPPAVYPDYPAQGFDIGQAQTEAARLFPREGYTRQMDALANQYQQETQEAPPQLDWKMLGLALAGARYGLPGIAGVASGIEQGRQQRQARRQRQAQLLLSQRAELEKERAKQEAQADQYVSRRVLQADQEEARAYDRWTQGKQKWAADRQKAEEQKAAKAVSAFNDHAKAYLAFKDVDLSKGTLEKFAAIFAAHAETLKAAGLPEGDQARRLANSLTTLAEKAPEDSVSELKDRQAIERSIAGEFVDKATGAYLLSGKNLRDMQLKLGEFNLKVKGPAEVARMQAETEGTQARTELTKTQADLNRKRIADFDRQADDQHRQLQSQIEYRSALKKLAQNRPVKSEEKAALLSEARLYESQWMYYKREAEDTQQAILRGTKDVIGRTTPWPPEQADEMKQYKRELLTKAAAAKKEAGKLRAKVAKAKGGGAVLEPLMPITPPNASALPTGEKPYDPNDPDTW